MGGELQLDGKTRHFVTSDRLFAILAIVAGSYLLVVSEQQIDKPMAVLGATAEAMSPRTYPRLIAALIVVVGAILLWRSLKLPDTSQWSQVTAGGYRYVALSFLIMAVYSQLVMPIGFVVASAIVLLVLNTLYGNRNFVLGALFAVFVPLAIFNLFRNLMAVPLPEQEFLPRLVFM